MRSKVDYYLMFCSVLIAIIIVILSNLYLINNKSINKSFTVRSIENNTHEELQTKPQDEAENIKQKDILMWEKMPIKYYINKNCGKFEPIRLKRAFGDIVTKQKTELHS